MRRKMALELSIGVTGLLCGYLVTQISAVPGLVGPLVGAVSGAWIGIVIATKGGTSVSDEMVMRIRHISGYYTFNATLYFIFILVGVHYFSLLAFSTSDLLLVLMMFMCITFIITRYVLMKRGLTE